MENYKNLKVDLTNCDQEPIHLIGNIQPHGFLLIVDENSLKIEQGSENVSHFLGIEIKDLLEKPLQFLLPHKSAPVVEQIKIQDVPYPQVLSLNERQFYAFVHQSSGKIFLECEPYQRVAEKEMVESAYILSSLQARLNELDTLESISELVADFIQSVLDIDRVVAFRFDEDWHAEVVAEKIKPGIRSFLGHHFPASDIPAPARALLKVKHIRHIPDISARPVAIRPYLNPSTKEPTNILKSELRNPSKIHLEYLRNMNVHASVSFSVIIKGKLWGLVSCHHEKPKFFDFQKRQLCDQVVKAYSNMLVSSKQKRDYQQFQHLKQLEKKLIGQLVESPDMVKELLGNKLNLLKLTEAEGAAILLDKRVLTLGLTPEEDDIFEIADWLSKNNTESVFHTRELSAYIESAFNYRDKACGLLALEISRFNKEYIFYFKPEINEKKVWAGEPGKISTGEDLRLHPRKSFEKWEEIIKGKSYPWTLNEVEIGQILLKDFVAVRLRNQNTRLEDLNEEYLTTAEGLKIKNKQLEDFTRIITHNLRSPLANIQGLYFIFKDNPRHTDAALFLEKIKVASDNMLTTIDDLNIILRSRPGEQLKPETVDLAAIIEKELHNLNATIIQAGAEVSTQLSVQEIKAPKVYIESIIHNLLSNALKYSSTERTPVIEIKSWVKEKTFCLSVSDNGLGIDLKKYGHKIFGIYHTFHQNKNSRGVGLYLTKMQVESIGGNIEVTSEPGKGTTFTVCFPYTPPAAKQ